MYSAGKFFRSRCVPTRTAFLVCVIAFALITPGCKKDPAIAALESDANGYVCLKCDVKYYTPRTVFLGPKCSKCGNESVIDVIGYYCEKDKHLTIRPRRHDPQPVVCDICKGPVKDGMRDPHKSDLIAWGATEPPK